MLRFSVFVMFLSSIICCISISAASSIPSAALYPQPICENGEVPSDCYNNLCLRRYCVEQEPEPNCEPELSCIPGCLCQEGYLRALNGTCVPHDMCSKPTVCGENEEYSTCSNDGCLQDDCSSLGRPAYCFDGPDPCIPGCICKRDYLRNANGSCVPIKDCPKNEFCSEPNEYYDPCPPSCPQRNCGYDDSEATCPPQPKEGDPSCRPSCRCKEGFYKKMNYISFFGDCVPYEDCSKICSGTNEYFVAYPETCEPQTCDSINNTDVLQSTNTTCNSECQCVPGFVRNKYGECIAKENCDKCSGSNEYFGCKTSCDNVCPTLPKTNQTECTADFGLCLDKCYCDEGYARDANNICIPIADCPKEK